MPGCSAVISSRSSLRRPATITLLPASCRRRARPRPMPEVPPVIRIVLPVIFMGVLLLRYGGPVSARSLDRRSARAGAGEEGLSTDRRSLPGGVLPPGGSGVVSAPRLPTCCQRTAGAGGEALGDASAAPPLTTAQL